MDSDFKNKNVPEIKQFLKNRGVKTTGYKKSKLVELAEEAELQKIPAFEPDNYIFANKIRRTVDGVELPHPKTVIDWSDDLNTIPIIEAFDVNHYLKNICNWTNERLKGYKNDNSYRLHSNGHIRDVRQSKFHSDIHYVKAACVPEERQSADPYEVWIVVLFDGSIHSAECTCVAGDGTCKHVTALLFGMQRFCQDLSDRSVISVTDKAAKWVNPVRTSAPTWKKFEHVARESYLHDKKNLHDSLECKLSGFVIDNNSPYLGCSPDGLLECKCCGQGCLEIKCPYKFSEETPINAACLDKTNFHIENDTPLMKRNDTSPYYCQIQCQLAVTKRKWCDFVLFTFKGVHHERIPFDEQFWSNVLPKTCIIPQFICSTKNSASIDVRIPHVQFVSVEYFV
ncbi:unnamed protein product [Mytilus edulis]|uniref:SWIM-type domain-containing protein n=1 Tax=Mytilus edulis TaxID=6550 RepID=A0A8S3TC58_MYTED|nr:unnamed protein product [Mytilus edulis]